MGRKRKPVELEPALADVVRRLAAAFHPRKIYLFGSKARGDSGPDSDYDLMVVVPDNAPEEERKGKRAYEVLWDTGVAADVLVWTESLFAEKAQLKTSLAATVLSEGKLVYAG